MCRAWPGFRCSNHPSKKVRQTARKLWQTEQEHEATTQAVDQFAAEHGDGWEDHPDAPPLRRAQNDAIQRLRTATSVHEDAMNEYNLTLRGREELEQKTTSEEPREATAAAAELNAAEQRIENQKKIAAILQNPDIPFATKIATANQHARLAARDLRLFKTTLASVNGDLNSLLRKREEFAARDAELPKEEREELAMLMKERARLEERIKQTEAHRTAILAWIGRAIDKGFDKALLTSEKATNRVLDFIL